MQAHLTNEDFIDGGITPSQYVIVECPCGTTTTYWQDPPGHRSFDEVRCSNPECGEVIGKT